MYRLVINKHFKKINRNLVINPLGWSVIFITSVVLTLYYCCKQNRGVILEHISQQIFNTSCIAIMYIDILRNVVKSKKTSVLSWLRLS